MNNFMLRMFVQAHAWMDREDGQDSAEYALIVAVCVFGAVAALKPLGTGIDQAFTNISSTLVSNLT